MSQQKVKKDFKRFFLNVWTVLRRREMKFLPGNLAYFFVMAIVPTLTLISYLAGTLHFSLDIITDFFIRTFGEDIASLISPAFSTSNLSLSFFITLIIGLYIASNGARSMIVASNRIYNIEDKGFIYETIKSLVMTIFLILLISFMLIVPVFGETILNFLKQFENAASIANHLELIFQWIKGPISLVVIYFIIKILYTMAPDQKIPSSCMRYGAIFTSIGWIIATWAYSFYITNFAHYSLFYGGLANLVILLFWFYILAYIFTIGLALNYRESFEVKES